VDAAFREVLLTERAAAADRIGLKLEPAEAAMLAAIPAKQLEQVVAGTRVSPHLRGAFMGYAAAVMLAALGATTADASDEHYVTKGIDPEIPPPAEIKPPEVTAPKDAGVFIGTVVDPGGNPYAGARVEIVGREGASAVADESGFFELGPLSPGAYTVVCTAEGMRVVTHENVKAIAGYVTVVNFALAWQEEPCGGARPDDPEEER
jgi:hypothetical protein